jgi:acetyltransferase-like isoleucine patch superfamily enzyme
MLSKVVPALKLNLFFLGQEVVASLPDVGIGSWARYLFYKWFLKSSGYFHSMSGLKIPFPEAVSIGDDVGINLGVVINACDGGSIDIGNHVMIGPYCVFRSADHVFTDTSRPMKAQGHEGGKIVVEDDCWLGSHVVVTKNVTIGKGSIIGAHSVVTRDIPQYSIAMGTPAVVKKSRLPVPPIR